MEDEVIHSSEKNHVAQLFSSTSETSLLSQVVQIPFSF